MTFIGRLGERTAAFYHAAATGQRMSRRTLALGGPPAAVITAMVLDSCAGLGGNTAPGTTDPWQPVTRSEYIRGIEQLELPIQRSTVMLEGFNKHGESQGFGHAVIAYDPQFPNDSSHLLLLTAFHVIDMPKQTGAVNWQIDVALIGKTNLISPNYTVMPNTHTPYDSYTDITTEIDGIMVTQLQTDQQSALQQAIDQGLITPATFIARPRDAVDKKDQLVGFVMADASKQNEGKVALLTDPTVDTDSPEYNYTWSIQAGDYCIGESGIPLFLVENGLLTNKLVAIGAAFYPSEANGDPGSASSQECTNTNVTATLLPNQN